MRRRPVWVSIEGVNGVGKTFLARELAGRLGGAAGLLDELTDDGGDDLSRDVITALAAGRSFLRTGHPLTETMALLALKVREDERVEVMPEPPPIVIEDRGVDTVAVYQAAILATDDQPSGTDAPAPDTARRRWAERIYTTARAWRPFPDRTVLLTDVPQACARRFAQREGRELTREESDLVAAAERLYRWRAGYEPDRIRVVSRVGRSIGDVLDEIEAVVHDVAGAHR